MQYVDESVVYREVHILPPLTRAGKRSSGKSPNDEEDAFLHDVRSEGVEPQDIFSEETLQAVQMRLEDQSLLAIGNRIGTSPYHVSRIIGQAMVEWEDYIGL